MKLHDLIEQQHVIEGDIDLTNKNITKLNYKGVIVKGNFYCFDTKIKTLIGSPSQVEGNYDCSYTKIVSLKGSPNYVGGYFGCHSTEVTSVDGAPGYIGGNFDFFDTKITSLQNIHKQIKYIGGEIHLNSKIKSHMLGVMLIKGLKKIVVPIAAAQLNLIETIINKHLSGDRDVHATQEELLEAGLREYAKI